MLLALVFVKVVVVTWIEAALWLYPAPIVRATVFLTRLPYVWIERNDGRLKGKGD